MVIDRDEACYYYKYRHLHDNNIDVLQNIFLKNEITFSIHSYFNDPYDCRPHFILNASPTELKKLCIRLIKLTYPHLTINDCKRMAFKSLKHTPHPEEKILALVKERFIEFSNNIGIYCLTKVPDNILMWSHYADSHAGICLQFIGSKKIEFFHKAEEVTYQKPYPKVDLAVPTHASLYASLLTKAKEWEYEKEYRILNTRMVTKTAKFPEEALTGVIFGVKTPECNKKLILDWCNCRNSKVAVYQARLKENEYGLVIDKLEISKIKNTGST